MCSTLSWLTTWPWHRFPMSRMRWALKPRAGWVSAPPGLVKEKSWAAVNTFLLVLPSKWISFKRSGDDKDGEFSHYIQDESEKYMPCLMCDITAGDDRRVWEEWRLCLSAVSCDLSEVSVSKSTLLKQLLCVLNTKGEKKHIGVCDLIFQFS